MARILVAEPSGPISAALRKFLESIHHEVSSVQLLDEAATAVREREPEVLIASASGAFDGETLCAQSKALKPHCHVVLVYPPDEDRAFERASQAGADGFLVGPLKRPAVIGCVQDMVRLRALKLELEQLEAEIGRLRNVADATAKAQSGFNTSDAVFFKKYLLLEVKRSKRYHYPVAMLLVALDHLAERITTAAHPETQKASVRAETLASIGQVLRDVDLAVPFADDRYLVFLPHTGRDGSLIVAGRIQSRLGKLESFPNGTACIGVAFHEPSVTSKSGIGFGAMLREATSALKRAQALGDGQVDVLARTEGRKRDRISLG